MPLKKLLKPIGRQYVITVDFDRLDIRTRSKILDIGCGSGRHLCGIYQFPEITVIGSDLNVDNLGEAKNRLKFHDQLGEHGGGTWALSAADITCLPFQDSCFDLVICSEVLEHIPDHHRAVAELVRVLKPGMTLVVSVPRYYPERICWALSNDYASSNQGHIRIYTYNELMALFRPHGLLKTAVHHAHSLHSPYWWLKCLLGPARTDSGIIKLYHRFLTWDIMKQPKLTRFLDRLLNPILGKSLVVYFKKIT
jgi:SAM-dependent methyltransferase